LHFEIILSTTIAVSPFFLRSLPFSVFQSGLCEVVRESGGVLDAGGLGGLGGSSSSSSSARSTPDEWLARGAHFYKEAERQESSRGFYESAATCFKQAGQPQLVKLARARLLKGMAKEELRRFRAGEASQADYSSSSPLASSSSAVSASSAAARRQQQQAALGGGGGKAGSQRAERVRRQKVDGLFYDAAEACLEARLGKDAAFCLAQARDEERAAQLYAAEGARTGSRDCQKKAARCFVRLKRFDDAIDMLWKARFQVEAVRLITSERRFGIAARLLDDDGSGGGGSGGYGGANVAELQQMARLAVKELVIENSTEEDEGEGGDGTDAAAVGQRSKRLLGFLRVLPVAEQVAILESQHERELEEVDADEGGEEEGKGGKGGAGERKNSQQHRRGGYLSEIIAVLTRSHQHKAAAAQCAAHGEYLLAAEVLALQGRQQQHHQQQQQKEKKQPPTLQQGDLSEAECYIRFAQQVNE
jgi:tetratricopeptide (TPR) repeat protein